MADKSTLNEVKYPEGDNIGYRLKFYTDTDGYNLDHEDGDWASFDAAFNEALDEIKSFKKYGTDIELIEIVKIITDEYITDDDEEDDYMEEEELLRSIPYDHKKYGWKVMSNLPSERHTSYVIHQIMDWGRDYTDHDTFRSIKKIADACERYDGEYTADEYEFVIRNSGLLSKATKNSRYRWNESLDKSNKLTLNEDLFDDVEKSRKEKLKEWSTEAPDDAEYARLLSLSKKPSWCIMKDGKRFTSPFYSVEDAKLKIKEYEKKYPNSKFSVEPNKLTKINEDLFLAPQEPSEETPATPEANGVAKLILDAINDESDTIKMYNDLIANTDNEDIIKIIQDITAEENNHLGMLQKALEIVSPNASNIEDGVEEAQGMITDTQTNVDPEFIPIGESLTEAKKPDNLSVGVYMDFVDADGTVTDSAKIAAFRNETWAKEFIERAKKEEDDVAKIRVELNESLSEELTREDKHDLIDYNREVQQKISDMLFLIDKENDDARKDITKASFLISDAVDKCLGDGDIDESLKKNLKEDIFSDESLDKSLNESFWFGKYVDIDGKTHKVYFKFEGDFEAAEEEFNEIIPEPYTKAVLSGTADEPGLKRDGFTLINEHLNEDLHDKFKKEIKNAYKEWAAEVEKAEQKRKELMDTIPDEATDEQVNKYSDLINDMYPLPDKFKFEFPHNIEKNDFPFYVTYYAEYPIYEPAEGGYYYPGRDAIWSEGFETKEEAEQFLDNFIREDGEDWEKYTDGYLLRGRYIGEDQIAVVEANNEYLMRVAGYEPYQ